MSRNKYLFLLMGYPGAGKTSIAQIIEKKFQAKHLWVDHVRNNLFDKPTHSSVESQIIYSYLNTKTSRLLSEDHSVVFDTSFNLRKDRDHLRLIANDHQALSLVLWINTPKHIAKQRALSTNHQLRNGYDKVMTEQHFEYLCQQLSPPDPDEHYLMLNGTDITPSGVDNLMQQLLFQENYST